MVIRIGWTKYNGALDSEQSRADRHHPLSKSSAMKVDAILRDNAHGHLSEIERAVRLTSSLIDSGAHLPAAIDFTSILMTDFGLWYLQCICPMLDITEIEDLSLPSQWIFACLVRTVPACYESVSRQLQGFPEGALQYYTSTQRLSDEINDSQEYCRHRFLLSLIVGGCASILENLLFHGLSIGDFWTCYLESAAKRECVDVARVLLNHSACLSLESSIQILWHMKPRLKTILRDPNRSETFCHLWTRILDSYGPLRDIDAEHALFDSLVPIFREAHLLSIEEPTSSTLNSDIVQLLLRHGASSPETSTRVLEHMGPHLKTFLRDPNKSEPFCHFLAQVLESCGPLQEFDDKHSLFESLVLIFQTALLLPDEEQTSSTPNREDCIGNKVIRLLLQAGLFRDSKLPARYWSFHDLQRNSHMTNSPLTLAIYVRNVYAIKLLLESGYKVDEVHHSDSTHNCMKTRGTPLTYAVWLGFIEIVTVLLAAGADVTKFGPEGQTAAVFAGKYISLPVSTRDIGFVEDTGSNRCEDGTAPRHQIFAIVCADLETRHRMKYEEFVDEVKIYSAKGSRLRTAGIRTAHPDLSEYGLMRCR